MEVVGNVLSEDETPARQLTLDAMQADFEYRMAQKITKDLMDKGLISIPELSKISVLNGKKFTPFLSELLG